MIDINQIDMRQAMMQLSVEQHWNPVLDAPGFPTPTTPVQVRPIGKPIQGKPRS